MREGRLLEERMEGKTVHQNRDGGVSALPRDNAGLPGQGARLGDDCVTGQGE